MAMLNAHTGENEALYKKIMEHALAAIRAGANPNEPIADLVKNDALLKLKQGKTSALMMAAQWLDAPSAQELIAMGAKPQASVHDLTTAVALAFTKTLGYVLSVYAFEKTLMSMTWQKSHAQHEDIFKSLVHEKNTNTIILLDLLGPFAPDPSSWPSQVEGVLMPILSTEINNSIFYSSLDWWMIEDVMMWLIDKGVDMEPWANTWEAMDGQANHPAHALGTILKALAQEKTLQRHLAPFTKPPGPSPKM